MAHFKIPGSDPIVMVADYELGKELLVQTHSLPLTRDPSLTSGGSRLYGRENPFISDIQLHGEARGHMQSGFVPSAVYNDGIVEKLRSAAVHFVDSISALEHSGESDFIPRVRLGALDAMLKSVFGIEVAPNELESKFLEPFDKVNKAIFLETLRDKRIAMMRLPSLFSLSKGFRQAKDRVEKLTDEIVKEGRGTDGNFLLSKMLASSDVPQSFKRSITKTTLAGALETSSAYLYWVLYELAKHPEWQEILRAEMNTKFQGSKPNALNYRELELLNAVIKETGRLYSPFYFSPRRAREELTVSTRSLGRVTVSKGAHLIISLFHANRDPKVWDQPENKLLATEFEPRRFIKSTPQNPNPYFTNKGTLTFGHGPHVCIGTHLAALEVSVFLSELLSRYDWTLTEPTKPMNILSSLVTYPEGGLKLKFTPRKGVTE